MDFEFITVSRRRRRKEIIVAIALVVVFTAVGFVLGYLVWKEGKVENGSATGPTEQLSVDRYHQMFQDEISAEEIEANLKFFTSKPHIAGSDRQHQLALNLSEKWREFGFDEVDIPEYKVLLSEPQEEKPNKVEVVLNNGSVDLTIVGKKKVLLEPKASERFDYFPYYAYSPNGTVSGQLVYINTGNQDDFKELKKRNISVNGTIVIARGRFSSTTLATSMGAIGALIFPDLKPNGTYPHTPWPSADTVFERPMFGGLGDPLTPDIPSIDGMYRDPIDHRLFGKIPTQPISHRDAMSLLSRLGGDEVPNTWKGGINITLRFGPGFKNANSSVRVEVNNQLTVKSIFNVIGTVHGREEPDRYVLIGNHRDAWFFGAADPSSGTAALTEITRVVGRMLKEGWRPRRTIVFCSWGGEEFGLIGSVEWVEQNSKILQDRGVVYLNTDVAVGGNYVLITQNGPLLTQAIFTWAKKVKDPNARADSKSLYEVMVERNPSKRFPPEPDIVPYRFTSDYLPFVMHAGIPSADFSYFFGANTTLYPVYHTQEDNFYWMKTFIDPHFEIHEAVTKFQGGLLIDLADTPLLPFDVARYPDTLLKKYRDIVPLMEVKNISTEFVLKAILKFQNASKLFLQAKENVNPGAASPLVLRKLNDQMVQVEKAFISSSLKYSNNIIKHVFGYNDFPGVKYALRLGKLDEVKRQWSLVAEAISSAADILKPV